MGAILQRADLRGTDLRQTSLHGADLARVWIDGATRFEDALMTRMRSLPRRNG
jgi:uncharacterized protein YjbI with pentapeptide repeats